MECELPMLLRPYLRFTSRASWRAGVFIYTRSCGSSVDSSQQMHSCPGLWQLTVDATTQKEYKAKVLVQPTKDQMEKTTLPCSTNPFLPLNQGYHCLCFSRELYCPTREVLQSLIPELYRPNFRNFTVPLLGTLLSQFWQLTATPWELTDSDRPVAEKVLDPDEKRFSRVPVRATSCRAHLDRQGRRNTVGSFSISLYCRTPH